MSASVESMQKRPAPPTRPVLALSRSKRFRRFLVLQASRFVDAWYSIQLAHYGGKYSIERMLALEEYTRNTSLLRVLLVTLGAPILVICLLLCQESIPLQDPEDSWKANYGFWIRVGLLGAGVGNAAANQVGFWLDVPALTLKQVVAYCALMGVGYVVVGIVTSSLWVFPIPFFMFTLCLPITLLVLVSTRLVLGAENFRQIVSRHEQLRRLNKVGSVQAVMYIAYPAYQVLFNEATKTHYELPVLLVLPAIRLILKVIFAFAASHKEDMTPAQVVFTVDFFDSYYFSTFIQSASARPLAAVMAVDLFQTASEMFELRQNTRKILCQLQQQRREPINENDTLLGVFRALCSTPETLRIRTRSSIKIRSCAHHQLSEESRLLLRTIECCSYTGSGFSPYQHNLPTPVRVSTKSWCKSIFRKRVTVEPLPLTAAPITSSTQHDIPRSAEPISKTNIRRMENTSVILEKALEMLFTSECLVLSEYMEAIVPLIYGMFVLAVAHSPSSEYHTDLVGVTQDNIAEIVSKIFAYALLEFASFVVFALVKKRACGISALYQLCFVLETQTLFVQSTLMMWILMTLTYRVVHFGTFSCPTCVLALRYRNELTIFMLDQAVIFPSNSNGLGDEQINAHLVDIRSLFKNFILFT